MDLRLQFDLDRLDLKLLLAAEVVRYFLLSVAGLHSWFFSRRRLRKGHAALRLEFLLLHAPQFGLLVRRDLLLKRQVIVLKDVFLFLLTLRLEVLVSVGVIRHADHELALSLLSVGDLLVVVAGLELTELALLAETEHDAVLDDLAESLDVSLIDLLERLVVPLDHINVGFIIDLFKKQSFFSASLLLSHNFFEAFGHSLLVNWVWLDG